jgi:hypothetical protein
MKKFRLLAAALILAAGCSTLEAKPGYLVGGWGGPHVAATFSGGLADLQFDCASGSIDSLVFPAKDGTFQAKGKYREGAPGPVRVGQVFRVQPATYSGKVTDNVMTLNVALEDGSMVGPFTLTLGAQPQITRCL